MQIALDAFLLVFIIPDTKILGKFYIHNMLEQIY